MRIIEFITQHFIGFAIESEGFIAPVKKVVHFPEEEALLNFKGEYYGNVATYKMEIIVIRAYVF